MKFEYFGQLTSHYLVLINGNYTLFDSEFCKLLNMSTFDLYTELSALKTKPSYYDDNQSSINIVYYDNISAAQIAVDYLNNKYLVAVTLMLS